MYLTGKRTGFLTGYLELSIYTLLSCCFLYYFLCLSIGGASQRVILVLFKSARKNMAWSGKKSDAILCNFLILQCNNGIYKKEPFQISFLNFLSI